MQADRLDLAHINTMTGPVLVPSWQTVRDVMLASLLSGHDRIVLTGQAGTGKTMLLRDVARVSMGGRWAGAILVQGPGALQAMRNVAPDASRRPALLVDEADRIDEPQLHALLDAAGGRAVVLAGIDPLHGLQSGWTHLALAPLNGPESLLFITIWLERVRLPPDQLDEDAAARLTELSEGRPRLLVMLLKASVWLAQMQGLGRVSRAVVEEAAALRGSAGSTAAATGTIPHRQRPMVDILPSRPVGSGPAPDAATSSPLEAARPSIPTSTPSVPRPTVTPPTASDLLPLATATGAGMVPSSPAAPLARRRRTWPGFVALATCCVAVGLLVTWRSASERGRQVFPSPAAQQDAAGPIAGLVVADDRPASDAGVQEAAAPPPPRPATDTQTPGRQSAPATGGAAAVAAGASDPAASSKPIPDDAVMSERPVRGTMVEAPVAPATPRPSITMAEAIEPAGRSVALATPNTSTPPSAPPPREAISISRSAGPEVESPPVVAHVALPPASPPSASVLSPDVVALLVNRGEEMLRAGDISAARLLFGRAADAGSSVAAASMGRTFDPTFLSSIHAQIQPDPERAISWYRRAMVVGAPDAGALRAAIRLLEAH